MTSCKGGEMNEVTSRLAGRARLTRQGNSTGVTLGRAFLGRRSPGATAGPWRLEAALARHRQLHAHDPDADLYALAAACAGGIIRNHPFVDGNQRAPFVALGGFLTLNGR
jgi:hypothetical protein